MFHQICLILAVSFLLVACGSGGAPRLTKVEEPREQAFSVKMPAGWSHQLAIVRPGDQARGLGFAKSPDGASFLFFGDAKLPVYYLPAPQMGMPAGMNMGSPSLQVKAFVPAEAYFAEYARREFGQLPGFQVLSTRPCPFMEERMRNEASKYGLQPEITTTSIAFQFEEEGQLVQAQLNGISWRLDQVWLVDVNGFITSESPEDMAATLEQVVVSIETNKEWQARENERHQQRMAAMQEQTRQIQAQTRASFQAHQQRMADMQRSFDAHNQAWANQQAAQDRSHERFIDAIREEETVTNGTQQMKVEAGADHYYVNPQTGEYIGSRYEENPDVSVYELWKKK